MAGQAQKHQDILSGALPAPGPDRSRLTLTEALLGIAALEWRNDEGPAPLLEQPADWGRFEGNLDVRMLDEGRICELLRDYVFVRPDGSRWTAPAGVKVDGASIPPLFWPLIGGPFEGKYRNASVIHDHYCEIQERSWRDTHRVFYEGMRRMGVGAAKAKIMYYAVYRFGPRWPLDEPAPEAVETEAQLDDNAASSLLADGEAIYVHDLSLEAIERLADARNAAAETNGTSIALEGVESQWGARARTLVVCGGSGTSEDLAAVAADAAGLPASVIKRFERERIRIVACRDSVTDFETDLIGKIPRGWEQTGRTWDSVPGAYFQDRRRVVVATVESGGVRVVPGKTSRRHGSDSLVVHECLHGFDYSGGHAVLTDPSFKNARIADFDNLSEALGGYLVQDGLAGLEETFAESGARFVADLEDMQREWPNLAAYWSSGIGSTAELNEEMPEPAGPASAPGIGVATFHPGGSIELDLRAEGPGGAIGHALLTLTSDDEAFSQVQRHLLGDRPLPEGPAPVRIPYLVGPGTATAPGKSQLDGQER